MKTTLSAATIHELPSTSCEATTSTFTCRLSSAETTRLESSIAPSLVTGILPSRESSNTISPSSMLAVRQTNRPRR
uniref:Uncharacterized protein n=1 Tax=Arundo donax TaxID=35708 RepID=A0A0A8Y507_ARUDO